MPTFDPNRAAFVSKAYRDFTAVDNAIFARNKNALTIKIETGLDGADALALANKILTEGKKNALILEIEMDGILALSSLKGSVPLYNLISALYSLSDTGRTFRLIGAVVDYANNLTTVTVRG